MKHLNADIVSVESILKWNGTALILPSTASHYVILESVPNTKLLVLTRCKGGREREPRLLVYPLVFVTKVLFRMQHVSTNEII